MSTEHDRTVDRRDGTAGRRDVLKAIAVGAAVGGLAAASRPVAAQADDLAAWLSNVDNADGVVDRTGEESVTVEVGVQANGGAFGFGPAVVRVDPGTTVVWEWTGEGAPHDVAATDGSFESELLSEAGATFEHGVESEGVIRYVCTPHESLGMKGAIVVGDADVSLDETSGSDANGGNSDTGGGSGGSDRSGNESGGTGDGDEAPAGSFNYGDWFEDTDNFEGTVDRTGESEVRIAVGAGEDGLAFDPPAVRIGPGTTVVWEWTGEGGQHNVAGEEHGFESPLQGEEGATYALKFDGNGIVKYACTPHEAAGMRGAIVVGDPTQDAVIDWVKTGLVGLAGAIVAAPFVASEILARRRHEDGGRRTDRTRPGGRP